MIDAIASHYTKDAGATLVRLFSDYMTVYAVRLDEGAYVALPEKWWIGYLGFSACSDIKRVEDDFLHAMENHGIIDLELAL